MDSMTYFSELTLKQVTQVIITFVSKTPKDMDSVTYFSELKLAFSAVLVATLLAPVPGVLLAHPDGLAVLPSPGYGRSRVALGPGVDFMKKNSGRSSQILT
jgi:hypothetical protein